MFRQILYGKGDYTGEILGPPAALSPDSTDVGFFSEDVPEKPDRQDPE